MNGRYYPVVGEKHIHRTAGAKRFSFTPVEIVAHETTYEHQGPWSTRWTSIYLIKTRAKYVLVAENVSLWQGEGSSHSCEVFDTFDQLVETVRDYPLGEAVLDSLIEEGLVNESDFVEDIESEVT